MRQLIKIQIGTVLLMTNRDSLEFTLTCQEDSNSQAKFLKSLYGICQSPRNFFQHLKSKLEAIGFESQENIDPCLFLSDKVIALVYGDNTLLFSPDDAYIDDVIFKLRQSDMELEVEDSVAGFFGMNIKRNNSDGSIELTQQGLAKLVVDALNLGNCAHKLTPASSIP
jgi:Reverse transcriptase (RNA-dependent DNA polymerase)